MMGSLHELKMKISETVKEAEETVKRYKCPSCGAARTKYCVVMRSRYSKRKWDPVANKWIDTKPPSEALTLHPARWARAVNALVKKAEGR